MDESSVEPHTLYEDNAIADSYLSPFRFITCIPCILTFFTDVVALLAIFLGQLWKGNVQYLLIASMCSSTLIYCVALTVQKTNMTNLMLKQEHVVVILFMWILKYSYDVFSMSLVAMTIDQHFSIMFPLAYPQRMSLRRRIGITAGVWIFSLIDIIVAALLWNYDKPPEPNKVMPFWYIMVSFTSFVLVPSLVSTILQVSNLCIAKRHMSRINAQVAPETRIVNMKDQMRKTITNIVVLIIFCLSWMSTEITLVLSFVAPSPKEGSPMHIMYNLNLVVLFSFCMCVPLIYAIRMRDIYGKLKEWCMKLSD